MGAAVESPDGPASDTRPAKVNTLAGDALRGEGPFQRADVPFDTATKPTGRGQEEHPAGRSWHLACSKKTAACGSHMTRHELRAFAPEKWARRSRAQTAL